MLIPLHVFRDKRSLGLILLEDMEPEGRAPVGTGKDGKSVWATGVLTDLMSVCAQSYPTEAHACTYSVLKDGQPLARQPRLRKDSLPAVRAAGYEVACSTVWMDLDLKDLKMLAPNWARIKAAGGDKLRWADLTEREKEDTRTAIQDSLAILAEKGMEPHAVYTTSGGFRFVHALAFQVPVGPGYEALVQRFMGAYKIADLPVDEKCSDWTRFFKLPFVTTPEGEQSWDQDWFEVACEIDEDTLYVPTEEDMKPPRTVAVVDIVRTNRERPDPDQARDLVERLNSRNVWTMTDEARKAKKELEDAATFSWIFQKGLLAFQGARHDTLTRAIGEVVGTLHGYPWASPEFVYGLLMEPAARVGDDEDWTGKTWEMICSFWDKQEQQKAQQAAEVAEKVKEVEKRAETERERFLRGARTWLQDLQDMSDEDAISYVQGNKFGVLEDARRDLYHVLLPSGFYDEHACAAKSLPKVIEQRGMSWLVPTEAPRDDGRGNVSYVQMNPLTIIQRSARAYTSEEIRLDQRGSYLKRDRENRDVFVSVPFYLRDDIEPICVPTIYESWLAAAGGDHDRREQMLMALGSLLLFQYGPTAAVLLWGEGNGGKTLTGLGMAECISTGYLADGAALTDNFNDALRRSPILNIEEAADKGQKGIDGAASLRRLITATNLWIEGKGRDKTTMQGVHRVLLTANSLDILFQLVGNKARSRSDWRAVGERIAEFHLDDEATRWFDKNNRGWRETRKWIGSFGRVGLYAHFWMWVIKELIQWEDGRPRMLGRRLLYEGNAVGRLVGKLESNAGTVPEVACAINSLLGGAGKPRALLEKGKIYVASQAVVDAVTSVNGKLNAADVRSSLETLLDPTQPEGRLTVKGHQARWKVLDAKVLLSIIEQHAVPNKLFGDLQP